MLPAHAIKSDPNHSYPLVLEDYRPLLQQAVLELALLRKFQAGKRKAEVARGKEERDADFADNGQDTGDSGHE